MVTLANAPKTRPRLSDVMRKLTIAPPKNEDFCSLHQQLGEQNRLPWHPGMCLVDKQLGRKDQGVAASFIPLPFIS